ncbi:MAG: alcohol dehydrogenase catalytic domain-containing protein [Spirochaetes bacterium]|nr:alcohol dehydrogenase catalytic domain-containing protein [Spirochaetota bacterium]
MKAAVFYGTEDIRMEELETPSPGEGELLLKVSGCGVCGTDAGIYYGKSDKAVPPVVIGHEITGTVERVGPGVVSFREGQQVVVDPFIFCGVCDFCKTGSPLLCSNESFLGYNRNGGYCQYTVVPEQNAYSVPETLGFEERVVCETLATVLAGFDRLGPKPGSSFLILGAGTVGLLWNQVVRNSLPAAIVQTEVVKRRRETAAALGADVTISPCDTDVVETVRSLLPLGVDCIVDATGSTEAVSQALPALKKGGTFLSFGICPPDERLSLSLNWVYRSQVRIITSRRPPRHKIQEAVCILQRGIIDTKAVVTSVRPLSETAEAFRLFEKERDREIKTAIDPWK